MVAEDMKPKRKQYKDELRFCMMERQLLNDIIRDQQRKIIRLEKEVEILKAKPGDVISMDNPGRIL
jgi:hypothetical protein